MIYKIPLTKGRWAIVDKDDVLFLCQCEWSYCENGYAVRNERIDGKCRMILMHRVVLERKLGHNNFVECDHINRSKLDNHKTNLRPSTTTQSGYNRSKCSRNTSGYIGVSWAKRDKKWQVTIKINGKSTYLGQFNNKENAARTYDTAALLHRGEFAVLNFPMIRGTNE